MKSIFRALSLSAAVSTALLIAVPAEARILIDALGGEVKIEGALSSEARARVGGRVEGMEFDDGRVLQMGGEIIGTVHHGYLELAAELGLEIVPSYTDESGENGYDMLDGAHIGEDWLSEEDGACFARVEEEARRML